MSEKLLVVDGNSIINRGFYALPILTNSAGEYTNAVYGFMNIFLKVYDDEKPDYVAIAFDLHAPTFRHKMYEGYKGNRKGMPEELRPQMGTLKNLLAKMKIPIFELEGFEADDIIGTITKLGEEKGLDVVALSGDRDLLQLASYKTKIRIPKTKGGKTETESYFFNDVIEKVGVTPTEYIDVKALMGDASDNIPGVPGIGEKTATKIIVEFKSLESALENYENVTPKKASENLSKFKDSAIMSKTLAKIVRDVPIDFPNTKLNEEVIFNSEALSEVERLEFNSLVKRFTALAAWSNKGFKPTFELLENYDDAFNRIKKLNKNDVASCYPYFFDNKIISVGFSINAEVESNEENKNTFIVGFNPDSQNKGLELCRTFFETPCIKVVHNFKKIYLNLKKAGIIPKSPDFDVFLAAYLINSSNSSYEIWDIASDFKNKNIPNEEDVFGKGKKRNLESADKALLIEFMGQSAQSILEVYKEMKERLISEGQYKLLTEMEQPLSMVLDEMELQGMKVEKSALISYGEDLDVHIESLKNEIYEMSGEEFNINSPQQLGLILFEKLGLKGSKKTKTGYSTSADVLEKLRKDAPIVSKILDYRSYTKLKSTYVEGLLSVLDDTNKIHSTFNQTVASTGRISSTEPNLQNIPIRLELGRNLRKVFVPTNDDFVFVDADYSQIELRVLAHISADETLINAFNNGEDIHRITASQVFKVDFDKVTDTQRRNAKAVNFGIVYGISSYSLSQDLNISVKEADNYIKSYFEKYPKIKEYLDRSVSEARENGYAQTIFGRRRYIPEINGGNFVLRSFGERVAMNMPIQGTAADIIKIAMIRVQKRLLKEGLKSKLILQVHDELLVETYKSEVDNVKKILSDEMEQAVKLDSPLEIDIHVGDTWYDAK